MVFFYVSYTLDFVTEDKRFVTYLSINPSMMAVGTPLLLNAPSL